MSFSDKTIADRPFSYLSQISKPAQILSLAGAIAILCGTLSTIGLWFILWDLPSQELIEAITRDIGLFWAAAFLVPFLVSFLVSTGLIWSIYRLSLSNRNLRKAVDVDDLTRLDNRSSFYRQGEALFARQRAPCCGEKQHLSLLMLDADHFKSVNDTYGHLAGDLALKHLAGILQATSRDKDLLARLGGEEFAILLQGADIRGAANMAERVRKAVAAKPLYWAGNDISLTLSIGVTQICVSDETFNAALHRADQALYAAKSAGRNQVIAQQSQTTNMSGKANVIPFATASASV